MQGDATQMRQLFQNLIDNALKFHRADETPLVKIYSQAALPEASRAVKTSNEDTYTIVVEDNGIGFDQKYADRIFTPFQRLHSQRQYAGTGIGLAICRKIVERHHGRITAQSTLGHGTRFVIVLPVEPPLELIASELIA